MVLNHFTLIAGKIIPLFGRRYFRWDEKFSEIARETDIIFEIPNQGSSKTWQFFQYFALDGSILTPLYTRFRVYQGICLKINPPSWPRSRFRRGGLFSNFRPPSAAQKTPKIHPNQKGPPFWCPKSLKKDPLVSRDPDFEGGGLFSNISPDIFHA